MNNNLFELFIVATPIGNLNDISDRAINTIKDSDVVVCENPNHSLKLLNKLGIKKKLISMHDYNEISVIQKVFKDLKNKKIILISDAGSPLISDPGYKLVKYCIANNIKVTSIPGPSSVIPALQLSGIPINGFSFIGFFPKSKKKMVDFINKIKESEETLVFFVSSHKILICLNLLASENKNKTISVSKELTKINEKTYRGKALDILSQINDQKKNIKGEFVVVVEGKSIKKTHSVGLEGHEKEINKMLLKFSLTDVVEIVHKLTGITKNKVYKWVLNLKKS